MTGRIHFALPFLLSTVPLAAIDFDGKGFDAVWEARYGARGLDPNGDADGDGQTNLAECLAGTDPFDAKSVFSANIAVAANQFQVSLVSQPGKQYQLLSATTLAGPWTPLGAPVLATGASLQLPAPKNGTAGFFKVSVKDVDSDGDGLSDWAEGQLVGFDAHNASSFGAAGTDLAIATQMMQALRNGDIAISATTANAYEKEGTPAVVTFARPAAAAYPFTLFLKTSGATDTTKSSAKPGTYTFRDGQGQAVATRMSIPAGQASTTLSVVPTANAIPEVPRQLNFALGGSTGTARTFICDAAVTQANQKLLVAYLHPLAGVNSFGTGVATVRLPGDNDVASVTVTFSNLGSAVTSTQVVNASSSILQSVTPANYGGQPWSIRASQSFTTDQAVLDALLAGGVKLDVYTANNATGEIEGPFQPSSGSSVFQVPPDPAPVAAVTGSELDRDIFRFLTQATYGPTPAALADMQARVANAGGDRIAAYGAWIDQQLALPQTLVLPYTIAANQQEIQTRAALPATDPNYNAAYDPNNQNRRRGWWMMALNSPDQLRQRMAFALSQIFVISDTNSLVYERTYGSAHYYDMLGAAANGTYKDLLRGVATHPMMGYYLSHLQNQKATVNAQGVTLTSPDENFAREIMQLFSIGLVQLHPDGSLKLGSDGLPIPTYGQTDITEMARVFTGWSFSQYDSPTTSNTIVANTKFFQGYGTERYEDQWTAPMLMFPAYHDTGAKSAIGLSIPANQTGDQDLTTVVNYLAAHANTAPFICRRLIQRFTSANPSAGYLYRVSTAFTNSGGNFGTTLKAILLDPEARSTTVPLTVASAGKAREPLLRATAVLRALGGKSQLLLSDLTTYGYPAAELNKYPTGTTRAMLGNTSTVFLENPLSAPTVFNFYQPDYSPAGTLSTNGIDSPELLLANENTVIQADNYLYNAIYSSLSASSLVDQTSAPYNYSTTAQNLTIDFIPYDALYLAVVDTNHDGVFTSLDTATFKNTTAISSACEAVLDRADLMLCGGALKAKYGATPGAPRMIILNAAASIDSQNNASNSAANQTTYMRDRTKAILWLVMSTPECVIQK